MKTLKKLKLSNKEGFTLIDTVIGLIIMSIMGVGVFNSMATSILVNQTNKDISTITSGIALMSEDIFAYEGTADEWLDYTIENVYTEYEVVEEVNYFKDDEQFRMRVIRIYIPKDADVLSGVTVELQVDSGSGEIFINMSKNSHSQDTRIWKPLDLSDNSYPKGPDKRLYL